MTAEQLKELERLHNERKKVGSLSIEFYVDFVLLVHKTLSDLIALTKWALEAKKKMEGWEHSPKSYRSICKELLFTFPEGDL